MTDTFHTSLDRAAAKVLGEDLFADALKAKVQHILSTPYDGPVDPPFDASNAEADRDSRAYASPAECDRVAGRHYPHDGKGVAS